MNKEEAKKFSERVVKYYDPSSSISELRELLRNKNYSAVGGYHTSSDDADPLPLLMFPLDEGSKLYLVNPYFVREHLLRKGWAGWLWIISQVKGYYTLSGSPGFVGLNNSIELSPCYKEGNMTIVGNIHLSS